MSLDPAQAHGGVTSLSCAPMTTTPPPRRFPLTPAHPERVCWGCDRYCASTQMICGNGSVRTPHPVELFGDDWLQWEAPVAGGDAAASHAAAPTAVERVAA